MRRPGTIGGRSGRVTSSPAPVPRTTRDPPQPHPWLHRRRRHDPPAERGPRPRPPHPTWTEAAADSGSAYLVTQLVDGTHVNFAGTSDP